MAVSNDDNHGSRIRFAIGMMAVAMAGIGFGVAYSWGLGLAVAGLMLWIDLRFGGDANG